MSDTNYGASLQLVLAHEGGFVHHPSDPGGATNKGVTQAVYDRYRRARNLSVRSVRSIEDREVEEIYRKSYWALVDGDRLPAGLDYAVFDYGVNSGTGKAVKDLQRTLNQKSDYYGVLGKLKVDGLMGDGTIAAACNAANTDEVALIEDYCNRRIGFLKSLKTFKVFGRGWTRRVLGDKPNETADVGDHGVIDYAVQMAKKDLAYPITPEALPTVIGAKDGEYAGKAIVADQKMTSTKGGVGSVIAGIGVSGNTVIAAADQVKPRIDDSLIGKLALGAFALMMMVGIAILIYDFLQKQKDKRSDV